MNKLYILPILVLCTLVVFSCSQDELISEIWDDTQESNSYSSCLTQKEAIEVAQDFIQSLSEYAVLVQPYSLSAKMIKAKDMMKVTRSSLFTTEMDDTLFYIVNLQENQGYIVVAADKRAGGVLAYVEGTSDGEKHFDNDHNIGGYYLYNYVKSLDNVSVPDRFIDPSTIPYPVIPRYYSVDTIMFPKLTTLWGQDAPYNNYCPIVNGERVKTGCVATALAQLIAYHSYPDSYNNIFFDWDYILMGSQPTSQTSIDAVATLMAELRRLLQMKYDSISSSSTTYNSYLEKALDSLGYCCPLDSAYHKDSVWKSLSDGYPVYISGIDTLPNPSVGHGWIIDGAIKMSVHPPYHGYDYPPLTFFHCNWGADGNYNGYFKSNMFNVTAKYLNSDYGTRSPNFNYHLYIKHHIKIR